MYCAKDELYDEYTLKVKALHDLSYKEHMQEYTEAKYQKRYWPFMESSPQDDPQLDRVLMLLNTPTASERDMSHQEAVENNFVTIKGNTAELISNNKLIKYATDKGQTAAEGDYDDDKYEASRYQQGKRDGLVVLHDYQEFVQSCVAYPDTMRLIYPALELCNEAGEVGGKIKKIIRGDATLKERRDGILDELGDCMFPISALLTELGSTFEEVIALNTAKLKRRKEAGTIKGDGDKR